MFTIGCDPEVFLHDGKKFKSAIEIIKGTKYFPQPCGPVGMLQHDNVAAEFNIKPANNMTEFVNYINRTIKEIKKTVPYDLKIIPYTKFKTTELNHPEAKEFGCEPDLNAWTGQYNIPPVEAAKQPYRSCGGHIHLGATKDSKYSFLLNEDMKPIIIQVMDGILGIISVILDNSPEAKKRRTLYGKAGCYRPTEYGIEYRTLSNYWIKNNKYIKLMYSLCKDVLRAIHNKTYFKLLEFGVNIQNIINTSNERQAWMLLNQIVILYMSKKSLQLFNSILEDK